MFAGMTFAELGWGRALLVALSGLVVVFMMLAILAIVIMVISKLVNSLDASGKATQVPAPAKAAPAPAAAPVAAADDGELVAVMMAAVAEESGMSPDSFRITNVSAAPAAAPAPIAAAPVAAPAPVAAAAPAAAPASGETAVNSPMPGNVFKVECAVGQAVNAGDVLIVLEAMKMEIEVSAPVSGTVKSVAATVGSTVNTDDLLVVLG